MGLGVEGCEGVGLAGAVEGEGYEDCVGGGEVGVGGWGGGGGGEGEGDGVVVAGAGGGGVG